MVGPLSSGRARGNFEQAVAEGRSAGERVLAGGHPVVRPGFSVKATLFDRLPAGHRLGREETFGPVALISYADDSGLIKVNAPTSGVDFYAPFGGQKDSSYGPREQGTAALSFYSSTRTVTVSPHGG